MRRFSSIADHLKPSSLRLIGIHGVGMDGASMDGILDGLETFDLPGHGVRGEKLDQYAPKNGMEALSSFVGSSRCVLVGHSLGGYLSLRFAILHKPSVRGVCCIAAGPGFKNPDAMQKWNKQYSEKPEHALAHHEDALVMERLAELNDIPVLIVCGSEDQPFLKASEVMKSKIPNAEVRVVNGAGHMIVLSHKKELGIIIDDWIKRKELV
jgi:pimeloyl-ACP methyl ester carboxylesterase